MADNTENFDQLRKLLALKRHEQPPPGYFDKFSRHVISRLHSGDKGEEETFAERLFTEAPWLQRVLETFQRKPAFAGGFGAAACLLIISLFVVSQRGSPLDSNPGSGIAVTTASPADNGSRAALGGNNAFVSNPEFSSTNGLSPDAAAALFNQMPQSSPQRVNFGFPGGQ